MQGLQRVRVMEQDARGIAMDAERVELWGYFFMDIASDDDLSSYLRHRTGHCLRRDLAGERNGSVAILPSPQQHETVEFCMNVHWMRHRRNEFASTQGNPRV